MIEHDLRGPHGPDGGFDHVDLDDPRVEWRDTQWIADWTDPGDGGLWRDEIALLWREDRDRTVALIADTNNRGIKHPIRLLPDADTLHTWRVVDGHHRVAAAFALRIDVPIVFVTWDTDESTEE